MVQIAQHCLYHAAVHLLFLYVEGKERADIELEPVDKYVRLLVTDIAVSCPLSVELLKANES